MKPKILIMLSILMLTSLACSFTVNVPTIQTGPTETLTLNEAAPQDPKSETRITVEMGAGRLNITPGAEGLLGGTIQYNVPGWKPTVNRDGSRLEITQQAQSKMRLPGDDLKNEWNLKLGQYPLDLTIKAGAYNGTLDLSGVPITDLDITDGASSAKVVWKSANPVEMRQLFYKTGASEVSLTGLGYANFDELRFEGGAGSYTLDFSGKLQRDSQVKVNGGVSNIRIIIPEGTACSVEVNGGLKNVNTTGTWNTKDNVYKTLGKGPQLEIQVDMGLGNLELINE